jgi:hypothetical protein
VRRLSAGFAAGAAGLLLLLLLALPAAADITLVTHYRFANGDTLTRLSYYTSQRVRTTLPTGDEVIYNHKTDELVYVDHAKQRYWRGRRTLADSLLRPLRAERAQEVGDSLRTGTTDRWRDIFDALTDSVRLEKTNQSRKIAGYPTSEWVLTAGSYLRQERWIARSLDVPNYGPELQNVVISSVMDPLGRGLMRLVVQGREIEGLPLAGRIEFTTLSQQGVVMWETLRVISTKVSDEVWAPPAGYQRWEPAGKADQK